MGDGLVLVDGTTIPEATKRILSRPFAGEGYLYLMEDTSAYLMGDTSVISGSISSIRLTGTPT